MLVTPVVQSDTDIQTAQ